VGSCFALKTRKRQPLLANEKTPERHNLEAFKKKQFVTKK